MLRVFAIVIAATLTLATSGPAGAQQKVPESRAQVQLTFAPIVKRVAPAVVNVYATTLVKQQSPMFDDPIFRRFFGGDGGMPKERMASSLGSGVIIDRTGLIVTNHHVIKDATEIKVALSDKREFECDIVLKDDRTDLAIIKIRDKGEYPFAELGDSDALEVGDLVLAIGNPFGIGQTVTQGIVSALARTQVGVADFRFFIQTDAAINQGNSGGALVDIEGRVVGIPSAIYSRSGGSVGIGFAIPVTMVRFVAEQAKTGSTVRRPWLGATLQNVTSDLAESLGLKRPVGAIVAGVVAGGPAARAGLKVSDLLVSIDGIDIEDPDGFGYRFSTKPLTGSVKLGVVRQGKPLVLDVALGPAPETVPRDTRVIATTSPFQGATVANLSPAVAEDVRLAANAEGVVITEVKDGSTAARLGFQPGDIVTEVNGTRIDTTKTLERVAGSDPGVWRLAISRGGQILKMAFRG
jgi:Do/DeqQ family serine protease